MTLPDDYANHVCGRGTFKPPAWYPRLGIWPQHMPHRVFPMFDMWPRPDVDIWPSIENGWRKQ